MAVDWTKTYEHYKGQWVALEDDEVTVIASAETAKQALEEAQKKGREKPILFRVPIRIAPSATRRSLIRALTFASSTRR